MAKNINRLRVLRAGQQPPKSQLDTAMDADMSMTRYWKIENGYVEPTPAERAALARVLGVDEADAFPESVAS